MSEHTSPTGTSRKMEPAAPTFSELVSGRVDLLSLPEEVFCYMLDDLRKRRPGSRTKP